MEVRITSILCGAASSQNPCSTPEGDPSRSLHRTFDSHPVLVYFPQAGADERQPRCSHYFKKVCSNPEQRMVATALYFSHIDCDVSNDKLVSKKWAVTSGKFGVLVDSR